jgi:hypothetical protein
MLQIARYKLRNTAGMQTYERMHENPSVLDLVWTLETNLVENPTVLDQYLGKSNHKPLIGTVITTRQLQKERRRLNLRRLQTQPSKDKFKQLLQSLIQKPIALVERIKMEFKNIVSQEQIDSVYCKFQMAVLKAFWQTVGFVKKSMGKELKEIPLAAKFCCNKIQALKSLEKRFREKRITRARTMAEEYLVKVLREKRQKTFSR